MDEILFQSFIDLGKWDLATWRGTAFLHDLEGVKPPYMALVFENIDIGKQIFSSWLQRVGEIDEFEELRIAIVEGDILGESPGYSVHVSSDPFNTEKRAHSLGLKFEFSRIAIFSRINRMTPQRGSAHLARFKQELQRHKKYFLIPMSAKVEPQFEYAIQKTEIHLRQSSEITKDDRDSAVFPAAYFDHDNTTQ